MKKITVNNESEIDSMNISAGLKTIFHNAIAEGNVIYSPSQAVTYGAWDGLFYILIDFEGGNVFSASGAVNKLILGNILR